MKENEGNPRRGEELIERSVMFAKQVRKFIRELRKDTSNIEDAKQLARSSGSIGANYIEAQEALSTKDFVYRVKISRKEARESAYWLRLIDTPDETTRNALVQEATELKLIFNAIIRSIEK